MKQFDIEKIHNAYCQLSKSRHKVVLSRLNKKRMHLTAIEAYTYPEDPGCKHLFFHFKDSDEAVPYHLLTEEQLMLMQEIIFNL